MNQFALFAAVLAALVVNSTIAITPVHAQQIVQRDGGYWQWTKSNCGYVWKWYPQAKAANNTATTTTSTDSHAISYTYNVVYEQGTAKQGSTLYGYNEVADTYANTDVGALIHKQQLLLGDYQQIGGQATVSVGSLIDRVGERDASVAKILAAGRVVAQVAASSDPAATHVQRTYNFAAGGQSSGSPSPGGDLQSLVKAKCVTCHNAGDKKGNLDLSDLSAIDDATGAKMLERIVHPDPTKRMPPGKPLGMDELRLFFQAAGK
jgi:hypothetical protein